MKFAVYILQLTLCTLTSALGGALSAFPLSPFLISINLQFGEYKLILGSIFDAIFRQFSLTQSEICLVSSKSVLRFSEFLDKLQLVRERVKGGVTIGMKLFV